MTTAGLHAVVTDGIANSTHALLIGQDVPRIHHSDGAPVNVVFEHSDGIPVTDRHGFTRNLLAYPAHWPAPGGRSKNHAWVFATHEHLPWEALIPIFDEDKIMTERDDDEATRVERMSEDARGCAWVFVIAFILLLILFATRGTTAEAAELEDPPNWTEHAERLRMPLRPLL